MGNKDTNKEEGLEPRLSSLEVKVEDNAKEIMENQEQIKEKIDHNAARVIIDDALDEKEYISKEELSMHLNKFEHEIEEKTKTKHLQLIKWTIGTIISATIAASGILGLLL